MAEITFQVVEGFEAGQSFLNVPTPLTIGREEDNDIQLNDERVSRFHVKIQEDADRVILTDLDSTNGTRVNGHPVRLRVLQLGDLIMVGRTVLLYGGTQELKLLSMRVAKPSQTTNISGQAESQVSKSRSSFDVSEVNRPFLGGVPELPRGLSTSQTAELVGILDYVRTELLSAISHPFDEMRTNDGEDFVRVSRAAWTQLQTLSPELCRLINELTSPQN